VAKQGKRYERLLYGAGSIPASTTHQRKVGSPNNRWARETGLTARKDEQILNAKML